MWLFLTAMLEFIVYRFDLEWVDGWFDPTSFKSGHTLMPEFYSIFKTCNFKDPSAHG
jgi:hypothetical protein